MNTKLGLGLAAIVAAIVVIVIVVVRVRGPSARLVFWHMEDERSRGDLFVTSGSGGTPKPYCKTKGERREPFAFSADGARLVFADSAGPSGPWRLKLADGDDCENERIVASSTIGTFNSVALSPDGSWLVYSTFVPRQAKNPKTVHRASYNGDNDIFLVGPEEPMALSSDDGDDEFPVWSPDGATLAFVSSRDGFGDLYTADVASRRITRVTTDALVRFAAIAWSPDGSSIAIAHGPQDQRDIVTVSPTTGALRTVATSKDINTALSLDRSLIDAIAWSPTGTHLVVSVSKTSSNATNSYYEARVVSIAIDTGAVTLLVNGQSRCPAISPNGKIVAMQVSRSMPNIEVIGGVSVGGGRVDTLVKTIGCPTWLAPVAAR